MTPSNTTQRLLAWFDEHLPEMRKQLNDPATEAEIQHLESQFGHRLPDALRALYLKFNGQPEHPASVSTPGMFYGLGMHSIANALGDWKMWCDIVDEDDESFLTDFQESASPGMVKAIYANRGWLPIAHDWGGSFLAIDFDPGPNGTVGQVINAGRDEEVKHVIADSFEAFLDWYLNQLESGNFVIQSENGHVNFGTRHPPNYGLLDAVQVMFSDPSRYLNGPLYAPVNHGPPPEQPESLNLLNQRNQAFARRLDAMNDLPYAVRQEASSVLSQLFLSHGFPENLDLPDQASHEQNVAMAIDRADKARGAGQNPEHTSQAWELVHQFLHDEGIIDSARFNAVEAVRTNHNGRRDEILSHFMTTGGPNFYTAVPNPANPPEMPPGIRLFNERIESLERWLKDKVPDLPEQRQKAVMYVWMRTATSSGPPAQTIDIKRHEVMLAESINRIENLGMPPAGMPPELRPDSAEQEHQCWELLHQWMLENTVIDQHQFEAVEAVRLNMNGRRDEIVRQS